jgi:regulatory protein RepA
MKRIALLPRNVRNQAVEVGATGEDQSRVSIDLRPGVMDLMACFTTEPPPLDFIWPGFLSGTIGALVAAGSTGKSFWSLEAALCVASPKANTELLDLEIAKHGHVVLLNAEDNPLLLWHRLRDIACALSDEAKAEVAASVSVVSVVGWGVDINKDAWVEAIIDLAKGARLIVLDTHSRWAGGVPENDNAAQTQVIKRYEHIALKTKAAILFLHHVAKVMMLDGRQDEQGAARGASAITDAARYQAWMQGMPEKSADELGIAKEERSLYVGFGAAKVNAGMKPEPRWYRRCDGGVLLPLFTRSELAARAPLTASERYHIKNHGSLAKRAAGAGLPPELARNIAAASPFAHLS